MKKNYHRIIAVIFLSILIINSFITPVMAKKEPSPMLNPQILLTKIITENNIEIKNITHSPLVLDFIGCSYEPLSSSPFIVHTDIHISADDITLSDAIIAGDLYINGNNIILNHLEVTGSILISPDTDGILKLNNVTSKGIEMNYGESAGTNPLMDSPENLEKASRSGMEELNRSYLNQPEKGSIGNSVASRPDRAYLELITINDYDDSLIVVNKTRSLPTTWKPKDLKILKVPYKGRPEARYLRKEAADALEKLFEKAKKDSVKICAISGFRSYELQKVVHTKYVSRLGKNVAGTVSAPPGYSEHQTGLAVDISSGSVNYQLVTSFGSTREGKWLSQNADDFGFILRYPEGKTSITGYSYEPWHIRYIGIEPAKDIATKGLTFEEYLNVGQS